VTLLHIPSGSIQWVGLESWGGVGSTITSGDNSLPGFHIVYIDFNHKVDIQVAGLDTISIHNGDTATRAGSVTLIW